MKTENIEIKSKGAVLESVSYSHPETLEEALKVDGPERVFKTFLIERKTRFMDGRRRVLTGGGVPSGMAKALKKIVTSDPGKLAKIVALLGEDAGPELKASVEAMIKNAPKVDTPKK